MTLFDELFDDLGQMVDDAMAVLIGGVVGLFARHQPDDNVQPVELIEHGGIEL